MPAARNRAALELPGDLTAFLDLEGGVTRRRPPEPPREGHVVPPERMVWIFGAGRGGSTWLMRMMTGMPKASPWNEPMVGNLFGRFYENVQEGQRNSGNFILGDPAKEGWLPLVREFVLGSAAYRRPHFGPYAYLIVKEPNASRGAPLLMEALPESRIVFLIRDPRDVISSVFDGARKGSWLYERKDRGREGRESAAETDPVGFARRRAAQYRANVTGAKRAYDSHGGPKALVRYEDLLSDTLGEMRRIYSELEMPVDEKELARVVEKNSWENVPAGQKGQGKRLRRARPGGWRDDLASEQIAAVERETGSLIEEFYPAG